MFGLIFAVIFPVIIIFFITMALAKQNPVTYIVGIIAVLVYLIVLLWASATNLLVYKSIADGLRLPVKMILSQAWAVMGKLFITTLLAGLAVAGGMFLLIIPGLVFAFWFTFINPVVLYENLSFSAALGRSRELVKGRFWQVVGYSLFPLLFLILFSIVIGIISAILKGTPLATVLAIINGLFNVVFGLVVVVYQLLYYKEVVSEK